MQDDILAWRDRRRGRRQDRHVGDESPEAAGPDRIVRIALFELHPYLRADRRHDEAAGLNAGRRHARHRPARWQLAEHVRHLREDAPDLQGIDVLDHRAAILAVEALLASSAVGGCRAHGLTVGTVETRPLRVSVKSCLYSPRLILWVTPFT